VSILFATCAPKYSSTGSLKPLNTSSDDPSHHPLHPRLKTSTSTRGIHP
jgi:hypothetical protein